ncbi:hypothetical protein MTsN3n11_18780 [Qipengyuania sp. MTN3-11]
MATQLKTPENVRSQVSEEEWAPRVDLAAAFRYFLERALKTQVQKLAAGRDNLHTPPAGVDQKVAEQTAPQTIGMASRALAWPALLRKLDRIDDSFRR